MRLLALCPAVCEAGVAANASPAPVRLVRVEGTTTVRRARGFRADRGDSGGAAGAASLANGTFDDGLGSWESGEYGGSSDPGGVDVENGQAVLREGDSFLVTLSQAFLMQADAKSLSFTIRLDPGFDVSDAAIPDAFEASLLGEGEGSTLPTWNVEATSFLNLQEDGTPHLAPGVIWDGERATVDVSGVPEGQRVTLYLDLIGADADQAGAVRIDDVEVTIATDQGFIRGNPNLDEVVNITDPIVILNYLFLGTSTVTCRDAADTNNDGKLNITDPIYLLGYLFLGSPAPPPPFPSCGFDEGEEDDLDCGPCSCPGSNEGGNCP